MTIKMDTKRLRQLFKDKSDCYADTGENGKVVQAMTEDTFIEVIKTICTVADPCSIVQKIPFKKDGKDGGYKSESKTTDFRYANMEVASHLFQKLVIGPDPYDNVQSKGSAIGGKMSDEDIKLWEKYTPVCTYKSVALEKHDMGNVELFKRILDRLKCLVGLRGYLTVNIPDHHIDPELQEGVLIAHADWETNTEIIKLLIVYYEKLIADMQASDS